MDDFIRLGKEFGLPVLQLAVIYIFIDRRVWPVFERYLDRMAAVSEKHTEQITQMNTNWLTALSEVKEGILHMRLTFEHVIRAIDDKIAQNRNAPVFTDEYHPSRRKGDKRE